MSIESPFQRVDHEGQRKGHRHNLHGRRVAKKEVRAVDQSQDLSSVTLVVSDKTLDQSKRASVPLATLVGAHVLGGLLDGRLAKGQSPSSSLLLATRAQLIPSEAPRCHSLVRGSSVRNPGFVRSRALCLRPWWRRKASPWLVRS